MKTEIDLRGLRFTDKSIEGGDFQHALCGVTSLSNVVITISLVIVNTLTELSFQLFEQSMIEGLNQDSVKCTTFSVLFMTGVIFIVCRNFLDACVITLTISFIVLSSAMVLATEDNIGKYVVSGSLTSILNFLVFIISLGILTTSMTVGLLIGRKILLYGLCLISIVISIVAAVVFSWVAPQISYLSTISAIFIVSVTTLVAAYISQKILSTNYSFLQIRSISIALVAFWGTKFNASNLTEANFSFSVLNFSDFRRANLTRTYWYKTRGLEYSRHGGTYLSNPTIRKLLVTCNGAGHKFDRFDLTGVNLHDAILQDAHFTSANLNHSDLRGADLSRAVLKQTQLDGTDLTGAILTGAYIEDWGITSTTQLENVQCDYIYMRVPTPDNPNPLRKPDNLRQTFADGEFAAFIQPFFDTLDLYHSQDVDPRAISIALKNLSDNHPDDRLQFIAMERRGRDGLNLRFSTQSSASKSELSHEYFTNYTQIKNELPAIVQMQLAEQNAEIRTLKGTIEQFIQTGTHHSTVQAETIQVIQGELIMTENRAIHINAGDNANITGLSSGDGVLNLGTIRGNVTNAINQLPDSSDSEPLNLKTLLSELQAVIQDDASLSDPDKSDLLEQVQALAEAKQTEEPTKREGITRKAMKMFDATLKSLPATASIAEACGKLLPLILRALGMPG